MSSEPKEGSTPAKDAASTPKDIAVGTPPRSSPLSTSPSSAGAGPRPIPGIPGRVRSVSQTSTGSGEFVGSPGGRVRSFSSSSVSWGRHILLAVDSSDNAKHAFEWYLEQIHKPDDMIVLVHCPEAPRLPTFSFKSGIAPPVDEWKKILDEMNDRTRKLEEDYEATCIQRKLRYKVRGEAMKNAGEGIIKVAESEGAEMIIIGTRGLGSVKRALLGSVSDYVVRNSSIPVVTVPKQKK